MRLGAGLVGGGEEKGQPREAQIQTYKINNYYFIRFENYILKQKVHYF